MTASYNIKIKDSNILNDDGYLSIHTRGYNSY